MKRIYFFCLTYILLGCSHANDTNNKEQSEKLIGEALKSKALTIGDDIIKSKRLYIAAYNNIDQQSIVNDELFIYSVNKTDSLFGSYEMNNIAFEANIKSNKEIDVDVIDGLCVMNKYMLKYSKIIDMKKFPESLQVDLNKAMSFQPTYLNTLNQSKDYLGQIKCLQLK
ncbi:hypothetical protein [Acinetobacter nematophilus]|uniref:Lipoprotein n=1 Tax=Acinetobacter nematophilus TaxID=2994642 RepID=A0A9X3IJ99_9GAMM|nr:hypothetical protein [Acinetobacter nematophilus]MCX5470046.1 hypothetical protein [Acinetobacter nematophilus]